MIYYKNVFKDDSEYAARKWRELLTFDQVSRVQKICGSVMPKLGYIKTPSEAHLKDLDFPVVQNITL